MDYTGWLRTFTLTLGLLCRWAFGWGEIGHQLIARTAAQLVSQHPQIEKLKKENPALVEKFLLTFSGARIELGHLANIPDLYWRSLDGGWTEEGNLLGAPTHYFDSEHFSEVTDADYFSTKIPLAYELAKAFPVRNIFVDPARNLKTSPLVFFKDTGTAPWRAQQFSDLLTWSLQNQGDCATSEKTIPSATATALGFAGLMAHFTGDASQPYHATADSDAAFEGQRGLHWYFENDLVNALPEWWLVKEVSDRARKLLLSGPELAGSVSALRSKAYEIYGEAAKREEVTALMVALLADSYGWKKSVQQLDLKFAVPTLGEAQKMPECAELPSVKGRTGNLTGKATSDAKDSQNICRRLPTTLVDGKSVAEWFRGIISYRLAVSAAITADIWVTQWLKANSPTLCATRQYGLKPAFISPTDTNCFGYALRENPRDFLRSDVKTSALETWKGAPSVDRCFRFN